MSSEPPSTALLVWHMMVRSAVLCLACSYCYKALEVMIMDRVKEEFGEQFESVQIWTATAVVALAFRMYLPWDIALLMWVVILWTMTEKFRKTNDRGLIVITRLTFVGTHMLLTQVALLIWEREVLYDNFVEWRHLGLGIIEVFFRLFEFQCLAVFLLHGSAFVKNKSTSEVVLACIVCLCFFLPLGYIYLYIRRLFV